MYGKDGQSAESDREPADAGVAGVAADAAGAGCGEARSAALPTFRPSPSPLSAPPDLPRQRAPTRFPRARACDIIDRPP